MERRQLGKTDLNVSVLGFGGAEIGHQETSQETVTDLLNSALDAGLNVIDTAECYRGSEGAIGNAIGKRRDQFCLFTKCGHPHGMESAANWSKNSILESIQRSLKRLKTEKIDVVFLHSCSEAELRGGEVIDALQTARDKGYTRYIGYSGDSNAAKHAVECDGFDVLQTSINIADQEAIETTLPLARTKNIGVVVKRPLANVAWKTAHRPMNSYHHEYWERLRKLDYDFLTNYDIEKTVEIALRFALSVPGVHTAIVGTTQPERWQANARLIEAGPLNEPQFHSIRQRWDEVAPRIWIGQT